MKVWKWFCACAVSLALILPGIQADAYTVDRDSSTSKPSAGTETEEEREDSNVETTITEKEETETVIRPGGEKEVTEPADIVFVIDSTGSMGPYIQNVAANVETFSKYLEDKKIDVRMAVMEYRDITCDGKDSTIIHTVNATPWHETTEQLVATLNRIKSGVGGGGDLPETLVDALGYLVDGKSLNFRSDAHKFAIVLTDAYYKEDNTHGLTMESVIKKLQNEDTKITTSVVTKKMYSGVYEALVGEDGITADISSSDFSKELIKIAEQISKVVEEADDVKTNSVKSVTVSSKGSNKIRVGSSVKLNAIIKPDDADYKTVSWVVADETIAGISVSADTKTCTVTGKKTGTTKVTAVTEDGGFTGDFEIKVIEKKQTESDDDGGDDSNKEPAVEISVDNMVVSPATKTLKKGKTAKITVKASKEIRENASSPEELEAMLRASIDSITYRSSNSSVASVNKETGKVKAKKPGSTVIKTTVVTADGRQKTFKTVIYVKK